MFWSFLLPVAFILLFNIIIFIKIIVSVIWKENKNLTRIHLINSLNENSEQKICSPALPPCVSSENDDRGLQICILYTFRSPVFKKKVSEVLLVLRVPGIQFSLHSEIYHVSKSQPAKHFQGIFRLSEISSENISLST
ncbi:hypothetical protein ASZ78_010425 [Callipepla squamata]|uniref:Uncharacterized protein n=1 Tax=Callipepla squamata TaxID=9009 RepID=A0A226N268_CALSU|nr:hypothetical protein ASZ78_010425 [Callipepla squamata]